MEGKYVEGMGNVRISEEVISTIVAVAALEVKGVVALMPRPASDIKGLLPGKKTPSKNVRVDEQNGQVVIELGVTIEFGHKLQEVSLNLQTEVKKAVEAMTGLTGSAVNVFVQGGKLPEPKEEDEARQEQDDVPEAAEQAPEDDAAVQEN